MTPKRQNNEVNKRNGELTYVPVEEGYSEETLKIILAQLKFSVDQLEHLIKGPRISNFDDF